MAKQGDQYCAILTAIIIHSFTYSVNSQDVVTSSTDSPLLSSNTLLTSSSTTEYSPNDNATTNLSSSFSSYAISPTPSTHVATELLYNSSFVGRTNLTTSQTLLVTIPPDNSSLLQWSVTSMSSSLLSHIMSSSTISFSTPETFDSRFSSTWLSSEEENSTVGPVYETNNATSMYYQSTDPPILNSTHIGNISANTFPSTTTATDIVTTTAALTSPESDILVSDTGDYRPSSFTSIRPSSTVDIPAFTESVVLQSSVKLSNVSSDARLSLSTSYEPDIFIYSSSESFSSRISSFTALIKSTISFNSLSLSDILITPRLSETLHSVSEQTVFTLSQEYDTSLLSSETKAVPLRSSSPVVISDTGHTASSITSIPAWMFSANSVFARPSVTVDYMLTSQAKTIETDFTNTTPVVVNLTTPSDETSSIINITVVTEGTREKYYTYRVMVAFDGNCEPLKDNKKLELEFWEGFVQELRETIELHEHELFLDHVTCEPIRIFLRIRHYDMNGNMTHFFDTIKQHISSSRFAFQVKAETKVLNFTATSFEILEAVTDPGKKDNALTTGLEMADIVIISVASFLFALLVITMLIVACRECYVRKKVSSFTLIEVPHVNLKLSEFTLTRIPRPQMIYRENSKRQAERVPAGHGRHSQNGHSKKHSSGHSKSNSNDKGAINVDKIRVHMSDHADGVLVGVTYADESECEPGSSGSNSPRSEDQTRTLLSNGGNSEISGGVTNPNFITDDELDVNKNAIIQDDGNEQIL